MSHGDFIGLFIRTRLPHRRHGSATQPANNSLPNLGILAGTDDLLNVKDEPAGLQFVVMASRAVLLDYGTSCSRRIDAAGRLGRTHRSEGTARE